MASSEDWIWDCLCQYWDSMEGSGSGGLGRWVSVWASHSGLENLSKKPVRARIPCSLARNKCTFPHVVLCS
jgi:hypothetical protein